VGAEHAIEVEDLVKRYGADFVAVRGISYTVEPGEIFGFLGPNGAGKTTTIKILATLLPPTSGRAAIAGHDVVAEPLRVREAIGLIFQDGSLDDRLTAEENLYIHALLYDVPRKEFAARADAVLGMVDLLDRRRAQVRTFSGGMRRRLEIARGLLHRPRVLFLDEPTVGLDPQTRNAIWEHVRRLRDEHRVTVFMTTHYLDEAEVCDRIAIIDHGVLVALGTPEELKRQVGGDVIVVGSTGSEAGDAGFAEELARRYQVEVKRTADGLTFQVGDGASFVPRLTADFPGRIRSVSVHRPTLDDVFLKLTGRAIRAEEAGGLEQMRGFVRAFRGGRR
jgi:ABC-2 type transport system ATP-binding protein